MRACTPAQTLGSSAVFTIPGETALTRTPCGARSRAAHCMKLSDRGLRRAVGRIGRRADLAGDRRQEAERAASLRQQVRHEGVRGVDARQQVRPHDASQSAGSIAQNGMPSLPEPTPIGDHDVLAATEGLDRRRQRLLHRRVAGRVDDPTSTAHHAPPDGRGDVGDARAAIEDRDRALLSRERARDRLADAAGGPNTATTSPESPVSMRDGL